ncbi:MAG: hypothetical protein K8R99_09725 [Actinomycetia bacterium]|nr:hypothetical protein [Actinomycetes bacterium]
MFSFRKVQAAALAGVLILAACSDDEKSSDTTVAATTPATEPAPDTTVAETTPPTEPAPVIDEAAAAAEVEANVVGLFDQLAIAGAEGADPVEAAAAIGAAAGLIQGGDCPSIRSTIPTIAGLAAAAVLTLVIDEAPTFNADGTEANYLFSALSNGNPSQLDHSNGVSVYENGVWKLSSDIWSAFIAMGGGTPEDMTAPFDAATAGPKVEANVVDLFDQLAIAGNPDSDPRLVDPALAAAACLIEGGDTEEVQAQIPTIAGLAFAATLTIVVDEAPTFNADGTEATYVFSANSGGNPTQLDHSNGVSVYENGVWKISSDIWAAFVAMGGGA